MCQVLIVLKDPGKPEKAAAEGIDRTCSVPILYCWRCTVHICQTQQTSDVACHHSFFPFCRVLVFFPLTTTNCFKTNTKFSAIDFLCSQPPCYQICCTRKRIICFQKFLLRTPSAARAVYNTMCIKMPDSNKILHIKIVLTMPQWLLLKLQ